MTDNTVSEAITLTMAQAGAQAAEKASGVNVFTRVFRAMDAADTEHVRVSRDLLVDIISVIDMLPVGALKARIEAVLAAKP